MCFISGLFVSGVGAGITVQEFRNLDSGNYLYRTYTLNMTEKEGYIFISYPANFYSPWGSNDFKIIKDDTVPNNKIECTVESYGYDEITPTVSNSYMCFDKYQNKTDENPVNYIEFSSVTHRDGGFEEYLSGLQRGINYKSNPHYNVTIAVNSKDFSRIKKESEEYSLQKRAMYTGDEVYTESK